MMTLFEDLRQALREICRAMGMSGVAATVVPLVVLGVGLNIAALNAVESMRNKSHPDCAHAALRTATRTELKVMRAVVVSTLKKIGDAQRRWCSAQGTGSTGYDIEVGLVWTAPSSNEGCDVTIGSSPVRKTAIAFVQCGSAHHDS
jgi:hypothetical protein